MKSRAISETPSKTRSRLTIMTIKNMTMTEPVVALDSMTASLRAFQSRPRYTQAATGKAYSTAMAADSVGVMMPP